jgi:predicted Rossmann fold flavoprotein
MSEKIKENIDSVACKNIKLYTNMDIKNISCIANSGEKFEIISDDFSEKFTDIIYTTGGMLQVNDQNTHPSKEKTYGILEKFGHKIIQPLPSLSPFRFAKSDILKLNFLELSGTSFIGEIFSNFSDAITDGILITHIGLSGPAILDFSALWDKKSEVFLNFMPDFSKNSVQKLEDVLKKLREGKNSIQTFFNKYVPKRLVKFLIEKTGITNLFFADITKQEMKELIKIFTKFSLPKPELFPYKECWTTKGGVSLSDINVATLESKKNKNFFIGGEILDIDGLCGGYHISMCALQAKIISENFK